MKTPILLDSPAAAALREWLIENYTLARIHGCDDRLLGLFLADAENDSDGLIEIRARDSVTGQTVTYKVAAIDSPEPAWYMNPSTGSIDTLDGWYPHGVADGLVQVVFNAAGEWVPA